MKLVCPVCASEISWKFIDFGQESAFCCECRKEFDCQKWINESLVSADFVSQPPSGAWSESTATGFRVGASTRSFRWLFWIPMAAFWSLLLAVFLYGAFHSERKVRIELFLFLSPFLLLSLGLWVAALMSICGKVVVEINGRDGTVFSGIGPMGWRRRFDWAQVQKIRISTVYGSGFGNKQRITLEGDRVLGFAKGAKREQLVFLMAMLRLMHRDAAK